ncbi:hypothetical protein [Nonlabens ponticola]|uniref:Uncharacterized protein n=1 Tax=Nonlabens ponticola TaxID=2496866 RepID=A0A3S9MZP3_9FLAO|nr:hypothetical protein [Nonlabens ponticola]AZQ44604.1 hypothetical protein EJ995_10240 [Nonlabens ponticola]
MSQSNSLIVVSEDTCYNPVNIYSKNGIHVIAFFEWSDKFSFASVVFSQMPGDKQVGKVKFQNEMIHITLEQGAKPLKTFNLNKKLEKNKEYPTVIDLNDHKIEDPTVSGGTIIRRNP